MDNVRYPIVELRQYALRPGRRDELVDVFDTELVESQEALGMAIVGQVRDLDRPDRFVWVRGFTDMPGRAEALTSFYSGPVWKAQASRANATMLDFSDVLLLRPVSDRHGFPSPTAARPPVGHTAAPPSVVLVTVYYRDRPFDEEFAEFFTARAAPALAETGAVPLARLQTEYAENTFPALPVRAGEHAFVWFARFPTPARLDEHQRCLAGPGRWQDEVMPALATYVTAAEQRRLAPTARSLLR